MQGRTEASEVGPSIPGLSLNYRLKTQEALTQRSIGSRSIGKVLHSPPITLLHNVPTGLLGWII